jgi:hypothetical protein
LIHSENFRSSSEGGGKTTSITMYTEYPVIARNKSIPISPKLRERNRRDSYRALEGVEVVWSSAHEHVQNYQLTKWMTLEMIPHPDHSRAKRRLSDHAVLPLKARS